MWNRQTVAACAVGRSHLALPGRARAGGNAEKEARETTAAAVEFAGAAWRAEARHRSSSGDRWLMRALEWATAKAWPLAVLDEMCEWLEDGSAGSRLFGGIAAAAAMFALLSVHAAALHGLQSLTLLPVFFGYGVPALVVASALMGATVLPTLLGHALGVVLRFYVLLNACTLAAMVGYGGWLLYSFIRR
jgi:hypothetical protein